MELVKSSPLFGSLSSEEVRSHNSHFGSIIRVVEPITPHKSKKFDFTFRVTVGAQNSDLGFNNVGDAWATYLWSPSKKFWFLGNN